VKQRYYRAEGFLEKSKQPPDKLRQSAIVSLKSPATLIITL